MQEKIAVVRRTCYTYPHIAPFRPSENYPELTEDIGTEPNEVYAMVRESFRLLEKDAKNFGTNAWNPLGEDISPGQHVLLKPNLVMDINGNALGGTECLYTQPSVVAAVLDYVLIALQGHGQIVLGDAPMQECDFDRLMNESGYLDMVNFYQKKLNGTDVTLRLVDFRELRSVSAHGMHISTQDRYEYSGAGGVVVHLDADSEFAGAEQYTYDNIRITNYDPAILKSHHNAQVNEYKIAREILDADVIINLPKPKTHRKGGVTISLKNLVGINCRKEYLPHHTNGAPSEGGDEYVRASRLNTLHNWLLDKRNYEMQTTKRYRRAWLYSLGVRFVGRLVRRLIPDNYDEGSWYGNDTISRTITDLNRILLYADKNGKMQETRQRKILIVADMIISGEKEGPVAPTPKDVGMIVTGYDPVCFDEAVATLMGARIEKLMPLVRCRRVRKYPVTKEDSEAYFVSNDVRYNRKCLKGVAPEDLLYFKPVYSWGPAFKERTRP